VKGARDTGRGADRLSGWLLAGNFRRCAARLWHDGRFTKESPSLAPLPGGSLLMVSEGRVGRVIEVGMSGRLWAWTGTTWSPLASASGLRAGAAAVYDPALGDLVVFGTRADTASPTRQTWLWNGSRWIIGP
jgi:hypothetical protein